MIIFPLVYQLPEQVIFCLTATNGLVNQLATITVEPVLNGCVGTTQVSNLVKPIPTVDPVAPQNICANDDTDEIIFEGTMTDTTTFDGRMIISLVYLQVE